jgi:prolyl-tRNA editing enzyme YbaK/EbsC (Cys-tRNA(Pro) deacylase)
MPDSTRTAQDAAAACGCMVGQIVKSLIFQRQDTQDLVLLLIAGDRQADLAQAAVRVGAPLVKADPKDVRARTGFAIGGVAPLGHLTPVETFMDPALLDHPVVWAAAGAPNAVFSVCPKRLHQVIGAQAL